ncbi:Panacea domain-containing protein [Patescibacteria group bacterium]
MSIKDKTKQFLAYLIQKHSRASITVIMKLAYLIDLISVQKTNKKISSFQYVRFYYGPYDKSINEYLSVMLGEGIIKSFLEYTPTGNEYVVYSFNDDNYNFDKLSSKDISFIDEIMESLKGYGAKTLTEITYKTKPLKKMGATIGGDEKLNARLVLKA